MYVRETKIDDINNNLLDLYIDGYNIHYEGRKDIFSNKNKEELENDLYELLNSNDEKVYVLVDNNTIVGYLAFKIKHNNTIWIDQFIIDKKYRNKGYGKFFIDEIFKYAKDNKYKRVELNCWIFNKEALNFYEELGFEQQRIILEKNL